MELKKLPLSEAKRVDLLLLLEEYHDVFCLEAGERGETDLVELHIDARDAPPRS